MTSVFDVIACKRPTMQSLIYVPTMEDLHADAKDRAARELARRAEHQEMLRKARDAAEAQLNESRARMREEIAARKRAREERS